MYLKIFFVTETIEKIQPMISNEDNGTFTWTDCEIYTGELLSGKHHDCTLVLKIILNLYKRKY